MTGFIESWGRGVEKICSACQKDGVPQPVYTINPGDIMIEFTAPEDRVIRSGSDQVSDQDTDQDVPKMILAYCSEARSKREICEHLGFSNLTYFTRTYLKPLIENGMLKMTLPDKPNSKHQRYIRA